MFWRTQLLESLHIGQPTLGIILSNELRLHKNNNDEIYNGNPSVLKFCDS